MDFIEVNGTALRYDLTGSGASTLVLITRWAVRWRAGT